ncbi:glycerophosphodiester phosphodiesterase family protein [Parapedobacter lycopersici]|uniref:glycerophosphodiester phosphodiesterase family protein n=1 Tax=Parapedobacter lycopersici TaxID=1864939 RepID=UPI00214D3F17|nr:glycerophosphodiester phosphodiesterase family protein [Parapedobacter lycopersici]
MINSISFHRFRSLFRFAAAALILLSSGLAATGQTRADSLREVLLTQPEQLLVAAHRGDHLSHPENSIPAFQGAIEAGAAVLELDVRQSKDGELVVVHDRTVDRTTDGRGTVERMTLEQLKKLRLLHNGAATEHRIPTLREALESVKGRILVDIDFKAGNMEAAKACYAVIEELGMEKQVLFFLYDAKQVSKCLALNPDVLVMPRAHSADEVHTIMQEPLIRVIHIDESFYEAGLVRMMREKGVRVWANSLGEYDRQAQQQGGSYHSFAERLPLVNIIQTDYPEALVNYLSEKK